MDKFIKKSLIYLAGIGLFSIFISVIIDPYNIYHYDNVRMHSGEMNLRYVKTKYILSHPDKFNSFIFGSSRVGYIHTEQLNDENTSWYNMTYSNGILPEIKETVKTFIKHGIKPKTILLGIDAVDGDNEREHINDLLRKPYPTTLKDTVSFHMSYLNPAIAVEALFEVEQLENQELNKQIFYEYGGIYKEGTKSEGWGKWSVNEVVPMNEMSGRIKDSLEVVKEICQICEENNIDLILFTTPLYIKKYLDGMEQGFPIYIKEIAKIHDIYSFSSINCINTNNLNYWEEEHFDSNVGDLVLQRIFKEGDYEESFQEEGFGVLVTEENAEEYYEFLMKQLEVLQGESNI